MGLFEDIIFTAFCTEIKILHTAASTAAMASEISHGLAIVEDSDKLYFYCYSFVTKYLQ